MSHPETKALLEFESSVEHHFAVNQGVRIHYAAAGSGKLLVFLHGFPDHWLGWWKIMTVLRTEYRVVAIDMRGYNLSDKPSDSKDYDIDRLVDDVRSVINLEGQTSAVLIGHDWGGFVAWHAAMDSAEIVDGLVVLNMPHPWAMSRELSVNAMQAKASEYVRVFRNPEAHKRFPRDRLSTWVADADYKIRHDHAMELSSLDSMFNYYRVNWPSEPYETRSSTPPPIKVPTLLMHGLADPYALPAGLNNVWEWIESRLEIVTLPGAGHFIQHDHAQYVVSRLRLWLTQEFGNELSVAST